MNDAKLIFSNGQAITTTVISTNVLDADQLRDLGKTDLFIHLVVDTSFSSDTETVDVDFVGATDTCTAGSTKIFNILSATAVSALVKGYKRVASIPRDVALAYDHFGVVYTATTTVATGKFNCWINMNRGL